MPKCAKCKIWGILCTFVAVSRRLTQMGTQILAEKFAKICGLICENLRETHNSIKNMVLVTGATGFLGQYIVEELLNTGHEVRVLVRKPAESPYSQDKRVIVCEGDVLDIMQLEKAIQGADNVIHAAAMVSFSARDYPEMMRTNVKGTENVVDMCIELHTKKLILISSIAALGRNEAGKRIDEETRWKESPHNSQYAISKRKAELAAFKGVEEGLDVLILNPGLILGAGRGHTWQNSTAKLFGLIYKGLPFYNKGINGVVGVKDVAKAAVLGLSQPTESGERFVLVAENMSQQEMLGLIAESLHKSPPKYAFPPFLAKILGFVMEMFANVFGGNPLITRQTVKTSLFQFFYDGNKITKRFPFVYTPMKDVIGEAGKAFLEVHADKHR